MSGMGLVIGAELPNPGMQISRGVEAGDWQFDWHGVKGWTYFLQQSPDALGWSYLPWLASGNDRPLGLTVRSSAGARFFRWRTPVPLFPPMRILHTCTDRPLFLWDPPPTSMERWLPGALPRQLVGLASRVEVN